MKFKKEAVLKWELFIGIIVAYLIIIGTAVYFFTALGTRVDHVKVANDRLQKKANILNEIDQQIFKAIQEKTRYLLKDESQDLNNFTNLLKLVEHSAIDLKEDFDENHPFSREVNTFETASRQMFDADTIWKQRNDDIIDNKESLLQEQSTLNKSMLTLRNMILRERQQVSSDFHRSVTTLKTTAYFLIGLPLIFILFIFNRVVRIIRELSRRSKESLKLNKEIHQAQQNIELTNWVLAESGLLSEKLTGIDDENVIAETAFNTIVNSIRFFAGALYIRRMDSYEYVLKQQIGIDNDTAPHPTFLHGEGLLGGATKGKEIKILNQHTKEVMTSSSSLKGNQISTIILVPLVFEQQCLGILEIGGAFDDMALTKTLQYLERVSRILAMSIKFGQSHMLVESLLEETQQQTEELEAQQEELRITNEELIYKTNLLEASEEELRVQQEELQQTNSELEEKAKQLELRNQELNTAQKIVEEKIQEVELASKYKSEFMANMSHELRTPLNSILILAKLLQDNKNRNLDTDQVKYASVIHSAGSDLLQLINELLDLAKIESGKVELNYERINMREFINNLENLFSSAAEERNISFTIDLQEPIPPDFVSDEYRLEQVLKNFLSNAFKFTDKKGSVELTIKVVNENLKFIVTDNGKGISEEKQQLIFEAFRQEDGSTSRKYGGTGLGLSISREIASLLGGRITLSSELHKGSTFTLIIPYKTAGDIPLVQEPEKKSTGSLLANNPKTEVNALPVSENSTLEPQEETTSKNLLIVEDDIKFADILRDFAHMHGFQVMLSHDGVDAVQKAKQFKPHAIILDVMLPLSDGWEVLKTLKGIPETKHIPIHMMSAANFTQREFIENGAIGFLSKPVSEDSLKKVFDNIRLNINSSIKKVLLIEDQEFQSEIIKSAFAEQNINVIQAFSASTALSKLDTEENIDCVILDIKLPDADGLDVLDQIKSMPNYTETPIIINTAYDLSKKQIDHIQQYTKAMVLKSGKSNSRLIDEVKLFLNKIISDDYMPVKNIEKLDNLGNSTDNLHGKTVLIADDDMRNVFALTTMLQGYNMEIEIANNGREAVDIVKQSARKIDIVLMDIMMPEMDGYEAIAEIRKDKAFANLPIIAVTAKAMKGDREKSIQIGASDYVSKPIDINKLVSLMRVWLS
ncbi:response regulator [Sphingobacterium paludis]|uniref:histidine kinase n=1 Tax=Sphingobacterium paludis TaxID=1476465 RepID=A0A4R7D4S3_9SPHI|nr:response regulator [Sphingobacterium paludis]TDS15880.1 signal transduction histidine kinase [Sphingobacterium paludis]